MISAAHVTIFTKNAEADRAFFRDVLGFKSVDAGGGWLIFALPPAEVAVHPSDGPPRHELYLMCDDIESTVAGLTERGVVTEGGITDQGWGLLTAIRLPS